MNDVTGDEHGTPGGWELVEVEVEPEWQQDNSGVYVVINRLGPISRLFPVAYVRLDLMGVVSGPLRSWEGTAEAVRKAVMQWLQTWGTDCPRGVRLISFEHASYIGAELACAALDPDYVQS